MASPFELRLQLGLQARVLERQPRCGAGRGDQRRVVLKRRVVGERSYTGELQHGPAVALGRRHGLSATVDEGVRPGKPVRKLERRIAERSGQRVLHESGRGDVAELDDEISDPGPLERRPQHADEEGDWSAMYTSFIQSTALELPTSRKSCATASAATMSTGGPAQRIGFRARRAGGVAASQRSTTSKMITAMSGIASAARTSFVEGKISLTT
jgi:hypothetical protein